MAKEIKSAFDERDEHKEPIVYSQEEKEYRGFMIERLVRARDQREDNHIELDDDTYTEWHIKNSKAANSYNPPRRNKEDSRVVSGTTQEKENSLLSALLNFNFEPNITAFDKNDMEVVGLGEDIEDLTLKSRKMERYDQKRPLYYKELLDQGTCFIEEVKKEQITFDKRLKEMDFTMGGVDVSKIKWETKLKKTYATCETNLLSGTSVFLGNIREFFLQNQPFAFIRDEVHYDEAKMLYGDWDRWKYVPKRVERISSDVEQYVEYRNFSLLDIQENMVEIVKYQDPLNNEMMISLNGVMMLPIKFPLTAISPSGKFTFAKGDAEPVSKFFAYSKSTAAKTKYFQDVMDEMVKMILLKMKKSFMPPVANNTGRKLSRKIFLPAAIVDGVNPNNIQEIGKNEGPTIAEFNTFQLVKEMINEQSLDPVFTGSDTGGDPTATEVIQRKQQQMMKLGQTIVGVINLEMQLAELRVHNIIANWTLPIDQKIDKVRDELMNVYRTINVESTFQDNGKKGTKIIAFDPEATKKFGTQEGTKQLRAIEDKIKKKTGKDIRFSFMDPEAVQNFDGMFYFDITPTERTSSQLDRVLFMQDLTQGMQLFGPQSINIENAKQQFAIHAKQDPDKFFVQGQQGQQMMPQGEAQQPNQQVNTQLQPRQQQQPSVNAMAL